MIHSEVKLFKVRKGNVRTLENVSQFQTRIKQYTGRLRQGFGANRSPVVTAKILSYYISMGWGRELCHELLEYPGAFYIILYMVSAAWVCRVNLTNYLKLSCPA